MKSILTVTMNPAVDTFVEVPRLVADRKLRCSRPFYLPGGGGINVSRAIRRLGGISTALFPAGGWSGDLLATLLEREAVPTNVIRIEEITRQDVIVKDCSTGCEYRLVVPGEELGIEEWQHVLRAIRSLSPVPDYVVASGSLPSGVPVDFFARLADIARERRFRLLIDSSGEPLRYGATAGTFLLKPNLAELATLAGMATLSPSNVEHAARSIVNAGHAVVILVSAGAAGALLVTRDLTRHIPAPLVNVVSRVGAGDSMLAGVVLALARGWDVSDAAQFGVAAGSAAVMMEGQHLCRREETEQLFEWIRRSEELPVGVSDSVALL